MTTTKKTPRWYTLNWRSLASFFLAFSGIILTVSGIVLYIAPPGRYANAANWRLLWLDKGQWEAVHTLFSYAAVIFAIIHLVVNWKVLVNYLWDRTKKAYRLKREFVVSIVLTAIIGIGTVAYWPPFGTIMDWGETASNAWEGQNPIEHEIIIPATTEGETSTTGTESEATTLNLPISGGWGRYTVEELSQELDVPLDDALSRFESYHIAAEPDSKIRTLSTDYGYAPSEIVDILLGVPLGTIDSAEGGE
jgi:hypothetical protein